MKREEKVLAVQRMQNYIEGHLAEPITLKMLAEAAGYSPFHSSRIFKELTGKPPFDYIRALRLSQAALRLRDSEARVVDVALDFVFDSHEGFTRAFSKAFGITPHRYSKDPPAIKLFMPAPVKDWHITMKEGEKIMNPKAESCETVFVQVIERPARKVLVKWSKTAEEYFSYCQEVGCDVWGLLCSVPEALYEPIGMWVPENLRPKDTGRYAQGVELPLDYDKPVPQGYDLIELSPCKMMVFQGEPFEDTIFYEAILSLEKHIDAYDPKLYGFEWADTQGPRFQLEPQGYRGYIEARPVRCIKK